MIRINNFVETSFCVNRIHRAVVYLSDCILQTLDKKNKRACCQTLLSCGSCFVPPEVEPRVNALTLSAEARLLGGTSVIISLLRNTDTETIVTPDGGLHSHLLMLQQHAPRGCQVSVKLHTVQTSWQIHSRVMTELHNIQSCKIWMNCKIIPF